jgi:cytochrome P450
MTQAPENTVQSGTSFTAPVPLAELSRDPYPIYAALRSRQPVAWVPELDSWVVTRYQDVRAVLLDSATFVTGTPRSLIYETFGEQMLTVEGDLHRRYRDSQTQAAFMPKGVRDAFEGAIAGHVMELLDGFVGQGAADIRKVLAARLPVLVMLDVFGLPHADEARFRRWYDSFEASLANHARDPAIFAAAASNVREFHEYFQRRIDERRRAPGSSFLDGLLARPEPARLSDDALRRNALIIFFGGISTVEALILNTLWALLTHPRELARVVADRALLDRALEETMRWVSPVQSAMRHPLRDCAIAGVSIPAGATVNCMLGSANRDETVFAEPDAFSLDRVNIHQHLGFATGPHACLGRNLAKAEARAAIGALLDRVTNLEFVERTEPVGHEFRQPRTLTLRWKSNS